MKMLISAPPSRPRRVLTRRVKSVWSIDLRDKLTWSGVAAIIAGGAAFCTCALPFHSVLGPRFERVSQSVGVNFCTNKTLLSKAERSGLDLPQCTSLRAE